MNFSITRLEHIYTLVINKVPSPKFINIKIENSTPLILEKIFLGRFEWLGYGNKPNNTLRLITAFIQTCWLSIIIWTAVTSVLILTKNYIIIKDASAVISITGVIVLIITGCIINERTNLYAKWNYLATTFNSIIQEKNRVMLVHRSACLGHDMLTMEMWNHRSFNAAFYEVLVWSVIVSEGYDEAAAIRKLIKYQTEGITFKEAQILIGQLTALSSPI